MQAPPVNLVLLGLLTLFFGLHLQRRRQQPYSGWLLGWIFVFLSHCAWDAAPLLSAWKTPLQIVQADFLVLAAVSFFFSFLHAEISIKRQLRGWGPVLAPALFLLDLQIVSPSTSWIYVVLAVVGGTVSVLISRRLVSRGWKRRRILICGISAATVVCVSAAVRTDPSQYLMGACLGPMLVGVAVLYLASSRAGTLVRCLGGAGLLLWAEFYVFIGFLPLSSPLLTVFAQVWDLPKYLAGIAMLLELSEASRLDVERLARRYRLLYENLNSLYQDHPHPMWIVDAASRRVLSANAAAVRGYGYSLEALLTMQASALELSPESSSVPPLPLPDSLHDALPAPGGRRALYQRRNGEIVSVVVTERPLVFQGRDAIVLLAVDVTQQDKLQQELFHRAHHDTLTQLPNRELLADRVAQVLARSGRDSKCAVLLTIDVDHFKRINDTYGHPVGDQCLKLVAARLQSRIRQVDTLARTGGEEFTAIIGGLARREDAETVAESLRRLFDAPLMLSERVLSVTISIGGAVFPDDGMDIATLTKRSDDALYRAKRAGRNRCMFTTPVTTAQTL